MSSTSYADLKSKNTPTINVLNFFVNRLIVSVYRKLTFRQKYKDPWAVVASEPIPKDIFYEWYKAIEDHSTEFGRTLEKRKNKHKKTVSYIIQFTHFGTFKYHFGEIIGKDKIILEKVKATTKEKIQVVCSNERPITVSYDISKGVVTIKLKYNLFNRYGQLCSF